MNFDIAAHADGECNHSYLCVRCITLLSGSRNRRIKQFDKWIIANVQSECPYNEIKRDLCSRLRCRKWNDNGGALRGKETPIDAAQYFCISYVFLHVSIRKALRRKRIVAILVPICRRKFTGGGK